MSLNVCGHCTTRFAIGVAHCPQCGNADYYEEGTVAKISRHGGATYVGQTAPAVEPEAVAEDVAAVDEEVVAPVTAYDGLLRADLLNLCRERGLSTVGNKDELVARLVAVDEATEPAEATDEEPAEDE